MQPERLINCSTVQRATRTPSRFSYSRDNTTRRTLPVWSYAAISGHWLPRERCLCCGEIFRRVLVAR